MLFQDSTTIPCVLSPVHDQVLLVARVLLMMTIPIATLMLWGKLRDGKPIFGNLVQIALVFMVMIGYAMFFTDGVSLVGAIADRLYPSNLILDFYETIWSQNLIPGKVGSFVSILSDPMGIIYILLLDLLKVLVFLFTLVRYALLAFLYVIGPLLCAVAVIPGMFFLLAQWARNTLEVAMWLLLHNVFIAIFASISLYQALNPAGPMTAFGNRVLSIGVILVLVLMFLFVPILTHLLMDKSYEGIGSFVGPQASLAGKRMLEEGVVRPLVKGELPFGVGEMKIGKVEKDIGQGRRVYKKSQLRLGPYTFTSLLWNRKPKDENASGEAAKTPKTRKSSKKTTPSEGDAAAAPVKTRSPRTAAKPRASKKAAVASPGDGSLPEKPKTRKKKVDPPTEPAS
ncbi:MAG: hypothetical protein ACYCT9_09455 [Leptospirillum sp.]